MHISVRCQHQGHFPKGHVKRPSGETLPIHHCNHFHGSCTRDGDGVKIRSCSNCPVFPVVSAICRTHDFPRRLPALNEAVESFLRQDYARKELVIINDTPGVTLEFDHPQVKVLNLLERCVTLGDKFNAGVNASSGSVIVPWDDDDIHLPWRISQAVEALRGDSEYFDPQTIWALHGGARWEHKSRATFAFFTGAFTRKAFDEIGQCASVNGGMDAKVHSALLARGKVATSRENTAYVYNWADGQHHASGNMTFDANYLNAASLSTPGVYKIEPKWRIDYVAKVTAVTAKVRSKFCYWSCDTRPEGSARLATMVASARRAGVKEDFHVFANGSVPDATVHAPGMIDIKHHVFKWKLLRDRLASLDYEYFVWLDSDNYFVRHPGDLKPLIRNNPMWCLMESETTSPKAQKKDWWGCPIPQYNDLLRDHGAGETKWNTNGGMWIVRREAIAEFVEQAISFHEICLAMGLPNTHDETSLAWLGQRHWIDDPALNTIDKTCAVWACDWVGVYAGKLPDGKPWTITDWLTGESRIGNPAIVHAMKSKGAMVTPKPVKSTGKGVGDKMHDIFAECGIRPCPKECEEWRQRMNAWGVEGCSGEHRPAIIQRLNAKARESSWLDMIRVGSKGYVSTDALLNEAIKRASSVS